MCEIDTTNQLAYCSDIPTSVTDQLHAKKTTRPLKDLDYGIAFSDESWLNVQVYINLLKDAARAK